MTTRSTLSLKVPLQAQVYGVLAAWRPRFTRPSWRLGVIAYALLLAALCVGPVWSATACAAPAAAAPTATAPATAAGAGAPVRGRQVGTKPDPTRLKRILQSAPKPFIAFGTVVDLDTGEVIFDLNGQRGLTPASVSKLFATAAAAHALKFSDRLPTRVVASPRRAGGGVATLAIIGGGDPSLSKAQLAALAAKVRKAGITKIDELVVDSTLFDNKLPRGFDEKTSDASYRAPIDALNVDKGTVVISVQRGAAVGAKPVVVISPPSAAIVVDNTAKMVRGKRRGLSVGTKDGPGRKTTVVVRGVMGMQRRRIVAGRRRVANAAFHAGHAFARMLRDSGVTIGRVRFGAAPKAASQQVAIQRSPTVLELMTFCNQFSHNGYAETFFKLAGQRTLGAPGTCAKGEAAVHDSLSAAGIDWKTVRLGNGSGLYHANRVTTTAVVKLLQAMAKAGVRGERWRGTLAVGGVAGTLRRRMKGPATRGKVFAKTGTLNDVTALAGYAFAGPAGGGHRYAFALFYNGVQQAAYFYRRVHDRFLTALLDPAGELTPKPAPKAKRRVKRPVHKRRARKRGRKARTVKRRAVKRRAVKRRAVKRSRSTK